MNYSTQRSGLELAISIKTMNFKDEITGRFTKNTKRVDGELRAEAQDCHRRQPFAVLGGYFFVPWSAADDAKNGLSSLKHNAEVFSQRAGRTHTDGDQSLFEFVFIGLYRDDGVVRFFVPTPSTPATGVPTELLTFTETLEQIRKVHGSRNGKQRR